MKNVSIKTSDFIVKQVGHSMSLIYDARTRSFMRRIENDNISFKIGDRKMFISENITFAVYHYPKLF